MIKKLKANSGERALRELTKEEFAQFNELYSFTFLSLIRTKTFRFDFFWISQRPGITTDTAESLIDLCLRLDLLRIDANDDIYRIVENVRTPDNLQDEDYEQNLKEFYKKSMLQFCASITDIPRHLRDTATLTLPANPHKLEKALELIRKFQDDLMVIMEDGAEEEVFRLCVQLYPVTFKAD